MSENTSAVTLTQGAFEVDGNGQATYRLPLVVPPGIAGFTPQLELSYSHRSANGLLGVGWNLGGLSAITRTKATYAVDGFNAAVTYGANDRFALDGQRLINIDGRYGAGGTLYYTEVQSWRHVRAGANPEDGFVVVTKDGQTWEYGKTASSRILATGTNLVRIWALNAKEDHHGNRIEYDYVVDAGGTYAIDSIRYTMRDDLQPHYRIQFRYEPRIDVIVDHIGGHAVTMSTRLSSIVVSLAAGEVIRTYALDYEYGEATGLSRIVRITESGAQSQGSPQLPPTSIVWQDVAAPGFVSDAASTLDQHFDKPDVRAMDLTGSGSTDVVQLWTDTDQVMHATTYLATAQNGQTTFVRAADTALDSFGSTFQVLPADVDGNGRTDLVVAFQRSSDGVLCFEVFLSDGAGGFTNAGLFDTGDIWDDDDHLAFYAVDANGDGRTDIVEAYAYEDPSQGELLYFRSYLSKFGDGAHAMFTSAIVSPTEDDARPENLLDTWCMDTNGDGMMDIVRLWQDSRSNLKATAYLSVCTSLYDTAFTASVESDLGSISLPDTIGIQPVDVNGDGVQDLLVIWQAPGNGTNTLHLTTFFCAGDGRFESGPDSVFPDQTLTASEFYPMDLDGHGLTAVVGKWISGDDQLMFTAYRASMRGEYRAGVAFKAGFAGSTVANARFFPSDVNGDGKADLVLTYLDGDSQPVLVPYVSSGEYPDVVSSITNPLGGSVAVQYAPLSDESVYSTGDATSFPAAQGRRFANPMTPAAFPAQAVLGRATYVVSQWTQANDASANRFDYSFTTLMSYAGAQLDLLGRGWQGFRFMSSLATETGCVTIRAFNQNFPLTGTVSSITLAANGAYATDPRVPKTATALPMSATNYTYDFVQRATGANGTPIFEVLRTSGLYRQYDYGAFDFAMLQTSGYDDYGNENLHAWLGYVDPDSRTPLDPAEVVYRHSRFQNDVASNGWALGFLVWQKDSANAADPDITKFLPGDYRLQGQTWSPGTYDLMTRSPWDDANNVFLTTSYTFDDYGNRITETAPGNKTTHYDIDPDYHAFAMRKTSPPNAQGVPLVETFGFDPRFGVQIANGDANGFVTIISLDGFGRVAARQGPLPAPGIAPDANLVSAFVTGSSDLRTKFGGATVVTLELDAYTSDGQGGVFTQKSSLQSFPTDASRELVWSRLYSDGLGRDRQSVRQSGQTAGNVVTLTDYDREKHITLRSLPFFSTMSVATAAPLAITTRYDVIDRPIVQNTPAGSDGTGVSVTTWSYGMGGKVTQVSAAGSPDAYTQVFVHHALNGQDKVISVTLDPAGANATTHFHYDAIARTVSAVDPGGIATNLTYDSLDRRRTFDTPDQNTTGDASIDAMTYRYDAATGWLSVTTDAAGATTTFGYDNLGRMTSKVTSSDSRAFAYTYDDAATNGMNQLASVVATVAGSAPESQYAFGYDAYANTISTSVGIAGESAPYVTATVFDPQKRVVQETYPDATVLARDYSFGVLVTQTLDGARADYPLDQYSPWQKAGTMLFGNGIRTNYAFDPTGQVIQENVCGPNNCLLGYRYSYDLLNQLRYATDVMDALQSQSCGYTNRRLTAANVPGFDAGVYTYDAAGNFQTKDGVSFTYQAHYPMTGTFGGSDVYQASYDACGRTSSRTIHGATLSFAYDGLGCLNDVRNAAGDPVRSMVSNYRGSLLRQKAADGTVTLYVGPAFLVTRNGSATKITKYLVDDRGAAASIAGDAADKEVRYFRRDFKSSVTHAFDASAATVSQFAYDGYGTLRVVSGGDVRTKYEQREWDADLGLYVFGARWYDVFAGRFLTPDTRLGSDDLLRADALNRFAFELNDPVNHVDPTGHSAGDVLAGIIFGVVTILLGLAATVYSISSGSAAWGVVSGALLGAGINGVFYSASHETTNGGRFWAGFVVSAVVGAAIGGVTAYGAGALGATVMDSATESIATGLMTRFSLSMTTSVAAARAGLWSAYGATTTFAGDMFNQFMANAADRNVVGKPDVGLFDGVGRAGATGAVMGILGALGQTAVEMKFMRITRGTLDEEPASSMEMGDETTRLRPRVGIRLYDTKVSRALLYTVSISSAAVDSELEARGL